MILRGKKERNEQVPVYKEKDPGGIDYNGEIFHMVPDPNLLKDPIDPSISPVVSFAMPPKEVNLPNPDINFDEIYKNPEIDETEKDPLMNIGPTLEDNKKDPEGKIITVSDPSKRPSIMGDTENMDPDIPAIPDVNGLCSLPEVSYYDFTEATDPLLKYIEEHQCPTGKITDDMLKKNDKNMLTTQLYATLNGKKFEVLLSGRKDTRQVNVFLIDTETDELIYLIVLGTSRKKSKTLLGKVMRGVNGEIIGVKYEQNKIDNPRANFYLSAFLEWAKKHIYPKKYQI